MYVQKMMRSPNDSSGIVVAGKQQNIWAHEEEATDRERERAAIKGASLYYIHHSSIFPYRVVCVVCYCVVLCFVLFYFGRYKRLGKTASCQRKSDNKNTQYVIQ
jgi:hypothetical protein